MSYPYGQPPHQPVHPAPGPGYPAPAYAAAPGPYGYPQPAPSGGTGITAGILALLGAVSSVLMAISMFILTAATSESSLTSGAALATGARRRSSSSSSSSSGPDVDIDFEGVGVIWGILYLVVALALLVGGIMLLKRSSAGRVTVIVACVAFIIVSVFGFGLTSIIAGLFAIGTLVLASLGSTKRWIEAGRAPAMAGGYGPAPYGY